MIQEFQDISLSDRNSFGVGQRAARLIEFETEEELRTIFTDMAPRRWMVLGGGNNILFTRDFEGTLIAPTSRHVEVCSDNGTSVRVYAHAGVEWDDLVEWAVEHELWGIENLSLIPGKAGAAPVQNIGAYGAEARDVIESVRMYCPETDNMLVMDAAHCAFGYRDSIFKQSLRGQVVITGITLCLSRTPRPNLNYGDLAREVEARGGATLRNIRDAVCAIRRTKLPDPALTGNAGSFFKNPVVEAHTAEALRAEYPDMPLYPAGDGPAKVKLAAGWLIDKAGMKGYSEGNVGIHDRQALVLINLGGASGGEVIAFARKVQQKVKEKFGVAIDTEVNII